MLKNLVGFVSGGASGLGKATVQKLASEGCKIALCDLATSKGRQVAESVGSSVIFVPADVRSEEDLTNAYAEVEKRFERLDFIVNCAGRGGAHKVYNFFAERPHFLEAFQDVIETNLVGTFNVVRLGLRLMGKNKLDSRGQAGAVITTAGFEAFDGQMGQCALAAASGGVAAMTLPLARDLGERGIRVACIAPGVMDTYLTEGIPDKVKHHISYACPTPKRFGKPEEFAHTVKFILENPYINGEVIRLDGALRVYFY